MNNIGFTVNKKLLALSLLSRIDRDGDGLVSQADYVYSVLDFLKQMNITVVPRVGEYLRSYFDIYAFSMRNLLRRYDLNDITSRMD